jgi:uncharacterized protein Veg
MVVERMAQRAKENIKEIKAKASRKTNRKEKGMVETTVCAVFVAKLATGEMSALTRAT